MQLSKNIIFILIVSMGFACACGFIASEPVLPASAQQAVFHAEAMHCADCLGSIDIALKDLPGVYQVKIDMPEQEVRVFYDPAQADLLSMARTITRVGYPARLKSP